MFHSVVTESVFFFFFSAAAEVGRLKQEMGIVSTEVTENTDGEFEVLMLKIFEKESVEGCFVLL